MAEIKGKIFLQMSNLPEGFKNEKGYPVFRRKVMIKDNNGTRQRGWFLPLNTFNQLGARVEDLVDPPDLDQILKEYQQLGYNVQDSVWKGLQAALGKSHLE